MDKLYLRLQKILSALVFVLLLSSCSAPEKDIEQEICDCLDKHYNAKGITFSQGMNKIEEYLLEKNYLKNSSMKEHIRLAKSNEQIDFTNITQDPLDFIGDVGVLNPEPLIKCIKEPIQNRMSEIEKNSDLHKFYHMFLDLEKSGSPQDGVIYFYEKTFGNETFHKPLYRNFFNFMALGDQLNTKHHSPYIAAPEQLHPNDTIRLIDEIQDTIKPVPTVKFVPPVIKEEIFEEPPPEE